MNDFFDIAFKFYNRLGDDESRRLYQALVMYNLTKNDTFFCELNNEKLIKYGIDIKDKLIRCGKKKVIFGAGVWGRRIKNLCSNIDFYCFVDNKKSGGYIDGLKILSLEEMILENPDACVIIATKKFAEEIESQLISCGIDQDHIVNMSDIISEIDRKLVNDQYFDLPFLNHDIEEVFVDVGVFDAGSSLNFVRWANNDYKKIYLFEANPKFCKESEYNLKSKGITKYKMIHKGLWNEETTLTFYESPHDSEYNITLDEHNCFDKENEDKKNWIEHTIDVVKMDDCIDERVTFIKMDIEGSEANAIRGAERIIREYKPKLAISVYHKKDDLWTIPKLIMEYNPTYKFYLRNYSLGYGESVLYAL